MTDENKPAPKLNGTPLENAKTLLKSQKEDPYFFFGGNQAFSVLEALVAELEAPEDKPVAQRDTTQDAIREAVESFNLHEKALKFSVQSYAGVPGVYVEHIIARAEKLEKWLRNNG